MAHGADATRRGVEDGVMGLEGKEDWKGIPHLFAPEGIKGMDNDCDRNLSC